MKLKLMTAMSAAIFFSAVSGVASADKFPGYTESPRNAIVHNGFGECWHVGSTYSKDKAVIGCDAEDSDGDGVINRMDKCPTTPKGQQVNAEGCPLDSDGDGVLDPKDACPGTPKGVKVDVLGCNPDSDNDGVRDHWDQCPNTPAGKVVDEKGCHSAEAVNAGPVYFDTDSSALSGAAKAILDGAAGALADEDIKSVMITGHTDDVGSDGYNVKLGEARAMSVKNYLAGKGVDAGKMSTQTQGEGSPATSNAFDAGRAKNRRVTIHGKP